MKKLFIIISIVTLAFTGCNRVEQFPQDLTNYKTLADDCDCTMAIETVVWYDTKIVWTRLDNPDSTILISKHKAQADTLLKHLELY